MAKDNTPAPQSKPSKTTNGAMRRKILAMAALLVLVGFGSVVYSLVDLQIVHYEDYKVKAENQQLKDTVIPANRGIIYDANMKVLVRFTEEADQYVPYLRRKAEHIEDYMQS